MTEFHAVVLGPGGVGKSALTLRFMRDQFVDMYDPTIEESFRKEVEIDDRWVSLELLDTAGIEQFTAINELYLKGADGFVLVYSITSEKSLRELEYIRKQVLQSQDRENIPMIVVGTKSDLTEEREVRRQSNTLQEFKSSWKIPFFETSSKKDLGVTEAFHDLLRQMMKLQQQRHRERKARRAQSHHHHDGHGHGRRSSRHSHHKCVIM